MDHFLEQIVGYQLFVFTFCYQVGLQRLVLAKSVFLTRHWVHLLTSSAGITRVQVSCSLWVQGQLHD